MICERDGEWLGVLKCWSIDFDAGDTDEFTLSMPSSSTVAVDGTRAPWYGDFVLAPGTEVGGIVDEVTVDTTGDSPTLKFTGRTWRGILATRIIRPDKGQDYLTISGTAEECVASILARQGLDGVFAVSGSSGVKIEKYQFARYVDSHTGLTSMLASVGLRMGVSKAKGKCSIECVPVKSIDKGVDENFVTYVMSLNKRPVNHLVCLGEGELKDRVVVDLYADADGKVSTTQTFTGIDEVSDVYDSNNEDEAGITEAGTEKLADMQADATSVKLTLPDDLDASLGDIVECRSVELGLTASSEIATIIVKMDHTDTVEKEYSVGSVRLR